MNYRLIVFDLDGTLYRGDRVIPDAPEFVQMIKEYGCSCIFLTNNSSKTPAQVTVKLNKMGIPATAAEVYTSSMATAAFIEEQTQKQKCAPTVYAIGEEGLLQALTDIHAELTSEHPQFVVIGIDRQFNYDKLRIASQYVQDGALLIGTNADRALPSEDRLLPGAGSLMQSVSAATGRQPIWIGKPSLTIVEYALKAWRMHRPTLTIEKSEILMIGDNIETDIAAAHAYGVDSALVLSGFSNVSDLSSCKQKPKFVAKTLMELQRQLFS
ncbi:HAD-IIA family hydrolase [Fodinisporobacter ferrooxydans]|uniref:Acid sugar phosphatase n=1 Tax=Fodinisporobacter ferrooxydans TaxID=2901836 RepID=A0ABY4CJ09_9BACL|nr:HAD-IIA family hydrolase [Alicyclobacillaceae bacterium MYW30-H2]